MVCLGCFIYRNESRPLSKRLLQVLYETYWQLGIVCCRTCTHCFISHTPGAALSHVRCFMSKLAIWRHRTVSSKVVFDLKNEVAADKFHTSLTMLYVEPAKYFHTVAFKSVCRKHVCSFFSFCAQSAVITTYIYNIY